jgi:hypothetical protein
LQKINWIESHQRTTGGGGSTGPEDLIGIEDNALKPGTPTGKKDKKFDDFANAIMHGLSPDDLKNLP